MHRGTEQFRQNHAFKIYARLLESERIEFTSSDSNGCLNYLLLGMGSPIEAVDSVDHGLLQRHIDLKSGFYD